MGQKGQNWIKGNSYFQGFKKKVYKTILDSYKTLEYRKAKDYCYKEGYSFRSQEVKGFIATPGFSLNHSQVFKEKKSYNQTEEFQKTVIPKWESYET